MNIRGFRGVVRDDASARAVYAEAGGIARIIPRAVVVPKDADDVVVLVRWAHTTRTALVPRGSGSSMAGGAVGAGVVVDLSRLRTLAPVDPAARRVWCGPGVLCAEVDAAAAVHGLRFPVDPSSGAFCTVGGMSATNAAGARTLRYGATRRWVTALDCVFEDGARTVIRRGESPAAGVPAIDRFLRDVAPAVRAAASTPEFRSAHAGVRKDSSGYGLRDYAASGDLVDLLVGSEGTLALFAGVELSLTPRPGATASVLAAFGSLDAAVVGAAAAREADASACELLDKTFLALVPEAPADAEAVLLMECEGDSAASASVSVHALGDHLRAAGASNVSLALDPAAEVVLWELRHGANPILARLDPALASMQVIEDGCVPPARLADYVRGVRVALERQGLRGAIFGHAGDAHVHVNPLVDLRDPDWRQGLEALLREVTELTVRLGGTLSGEHGDGRLRAPLLDTMWPPPLPALFAQVKTAFDPTGILNPGVKIPLPGERPIEAVKYDPTLPPFPDAAARALAAVGRDRRYAAFRLDLLDGA